MAVNRSRPGDGAEPAAGVRGERHRPSRRFPEGVMKTIGELGPAGAGAEPARTGDCEPPDRV
jgi:hypothetical protein